MRKAFIHISAGDVRNNPAFICRFVQRDFLCILTHAVNCVYLCQHFSCDLSVLSDKILKKLMTKYFFLCFMALTPQLREYQHILDVLNIHNVKQHNHMGSF